MGLTSFDSSRSFRSGLRQARAGDDEKLNELLQRWRPFIRKHAKRMFTSDLQRRADSSDVVQETLLRIHNRVPQFAGVSRAQWACWVKRVLSNEAKRLRRHHLAKRRSMANESYRQGNIEVEQRTPSVDWLERSERSFELLAALDRLPEPYKTVVKQRVFSKLPFAEIGEQINRDAAATRVLWCRGIKKLQQLTKYSN